MLLTSEPSDGYKNKNKINAIQLLARIATCRTEIIAIDIETNFEKDLKNVFTFFCNQMSLLIYITVGYFLNIYNCENNF